MVDKESNHVEDENGLLLVYYKHSQQVHLYTSLIMHTIEYLNVNNGITQSVLKCVGMYPCVY
jgi:hypothetical protein